MSKDNALVTMVQMAKRQEGAGHLDLAAVAREHAESRVLSERTRRYFAALARRRKVPRVSVDLGAASDAYFEAAASCATRGAQSMDRRYMLARLWALREADLHGEAIGPRTATYRIVIADEVEATLTITEKRDGSLDASVGADLRALLDAETD